MVDTLKSVQETIMEVMVYIDKICRENDIQYYVMGGTALGAARHRGFIPWDDDLDIFMTPNNYDRFSRHVMSNLNPNYYLQEWKAVDNYIEYAKLRKNGTTFIEEQFRHNRTMHHGIYVDIMILHKCSKNILRQYFIYLCSKFVTLVALSERNWKPKNGFQKVVLGLVNILPKKLICRLCYAEIYSGRDLQKGFVYNYFITKAGFREGIFEAEVFGKPVDVEFEHHSLMGPSDIHNYLKIRYGNYLELPKEEERKASVHASIVDTKKSYEEYL